MLKLDAEQAFHFYRSFLKWYAMWYHTAGQPITYLEIGCNRGDTCWYLSPYCKEIDGIDTERYGDWDDHKDKFPNLTFHKKSSDAFFADPRVWGKQWDLIFIDGDHSKEQLWRDIAHSLNHLAPDGLIVCHDTFPPSLSHTGPAACGTAWEAIRDLRANPHTGYQIYTFPVTFGVTLIAKQLVMPWLREPEPVLLAGTT